MIGMRIQAVWCDSVDERQGLKTEMTGKKKITVRCPACGKDSPWENNPFRPFCSERCRMIDLGKWASEDYRIPGEKRSIPDGGEPEKNDDESG
jgi:hypothetical protein